MVPHTTPPTFTPPTRIRVNNKSKGIRKTQPIISPNAICQFGATAEGIGVISLGISQMGRKTAKTTQTGTKKGSRERCTLTSKRKTNTKMLQIILPPEPGCQLLRNHLPTEGGAENHKSKQDPTAKTVNRIRVQQPASGKKHPCSRSGQNNQSGTSVRRTTLQW